ncbi:MAG: GNAT family N-acetyltransferase [Bacteroidales bacterium]
MMDGILVRLAERQDEDNWNNYLDMFEDSVAYHLFAWKQAIEDAYGFECPYFLADKNGRICGVFPTVHIHPPLGKGKLVSLPYCDVGGILADSPEIAEVLFNYACQYAGKFKIPTIEIRKTPAIFKPDSLNGDKIYSKDPDPEGSGSEKVRMLLNLPENSESLMASFKSKLRSQVNKPAREGLTSKIGGAELLDEFYSVFAENMRALGSPVHSIKWLGSIFQHFGEKAKCGMIYMPDKTPAAGGIILCHKNIVSIPWASSVPRLNRFNPNMLLYWCFLEFASDNGYQYFDFGRSTPNEGTYRFKAQWGAKPQPLHWEKWKIGENGAYSAVFAPTSGSNDRKRVLAENVIKKIPLPLSTFVGSRFRKYISL